MKRRLFTLALFLLLGAVVNVVVAWGLAYWLNPFVNIEQHAWSFSPDESWSVSRRSQVGLDYVSYRFESPYDRELYKNTVILPRSLLPDWGDLQNPKESTYREAVALGWPMLACWSSIKSGFIGDPKRTELLGGLNIGRWEGEERHQGSVLYSTEQVLPFRPIPWGFLINTIFYALLLWLLTLGPFTARRMIRRKRGRCIKCGYDMRGDFSSGCPECGWGRDE